MLLDQCNETVCRRRVRERCNLTGEPRGVTSVLVKDQTVVVHSETIRTELFEK